MMDEFGGDISDVMDVPEDIGDGISDIQDIQGADIDLDSMSLDELYSLRDELTDTGETGDSANDFSFSWDGTPTHNVEWDDEPGDTTYVLKR